MQVKQQANMVSAYDYIFRASCTSLYLSWIVKNLSICIKIQKKSRLLILPAGTKIECHVDS